MIKIDILGLFDRGGDAPSVRARFSSNSTQLSAFPETILRFRVLNLCRNTYLYSVNLCFGGSVETSALVSKHQRRGMCCFPSQWIQFEFLFVGFIRSPGRVVSRVQKKRLRRTHIYINHQRYEAVLLTRILVCDRDRCFEVIRLVWRCVFCSLLLFF